MMKRTLAFALTALMSATLTVQQSLEELLENPDALLREAPALPHANVIRGHDNPSAIPLHVVTLLMLYGWYGTQFDGTLLAADQFADRYGTDSRLGAEMVTAIGKFVQNWKRMLSHSDEHSASEVSRVIVHGRRRSSRSMPKAIAHRSPLSTSSATSLVPTSGRRSSWMLARQLQML